jgi:cyclohexanone monooxygenase
MALYEQADHVTYMVSEARRRGAEVLEPTADGEADYVAEVRGLARMGQRFYSECTPGYYNSEGAAGNRQGFFSEMYGAGSIAFFEKLRAWREVGTLPGLELR